MSSREYRFYPREWCAPVDKIGSPLDDQTTDNSIKELVFDDLKKIFNEPAAATELENMLANAGLIEILEEADILPSKGAPANPYDPEKERQLNQHWYDEHSEEYENYRRRLEERDRILRCIYVGVILNRNYDAELFPPQKTRRFGFVTLGTPSSKDL